LKITEQILASEVSVNMVLVPLLLSPILVVAVSSQLVIQIITSDQTPTDYSNHLETDLVLAIGSIETREALPTP
jgi:hypothetical protein